MQDDHDIIEKIYEAAFQPEFWPSILEEIAENCKTVGGYLITARGSDQSWTSTNNLQPIISDYINEGWFARCGRRVCMAHTAHTSFLREIDYWTPEEIEANESYREFFWPRGWGISAGTGFYIPTGDAIAVFFERRLNQSPLNSDNIAFLNRLRPHIARSAMVSARLHLKAAKSATTTMAKLEIPTLLIDSQKSVIETHHLDQLPEGSLIIGAKNKVLFRDKSANQMLHNGLSSLGHAQSGHVNSFPIKDKEAHAHLVAHLIPISGSCQDVFNRGYAVLVITPSFKTPIPNVDVIRSLFDLTPAEARIARGLATGYSLDELAAKSNVAKSTVRTQLRGVLEKTGNSRQAELVTMMTSLTLKRESK